MVNTDETEEFAPQTDESNTTRLTTARYSTIVISICAFIGGIIVGSASLYLYQYFNDKPSADDTNWRNTLPENVEIYFHNLVPDTQDYSAYYTDTPHQDDVTWHSHPKTLGDLRLLNTSIGSRGKYQYIEIGTYKNEPILFVQTPCEDNCVSNSHLILYGSTENGYYLVTKHSSYNPQLDYLHLLEDSIITIDDDLRFNAIPTQTLDNGLHFDPLLSEILEVEGVKMAVGTPKEFYSNTPFNNTNNQSPMYKTEFVAKTKYGPVFRGHTRIWGDTVDDIEYLLRLQNGLAIKLEHTLFFDGDPTYDGTTYSVKGDTRIPQIVWVDGTSNTTSYRNDGIRGCGEEGLEILIDPLKETDIQLAGHTSTMEPIFALINPEHPLMERIFDRSDTAVFYYQPDIYSRTILPIEISRKDFIDQRGILIYKDKFGLQQILTHTHYSPQVECDRPVQADFY